MFEEALARKQRFIKALSHKPEVVVKPQMIIEEIVEQPRTETIMNYGDKDDSITKPTGLILCAEELELDGEFGNFDKWLKGKKKGAKKRDTSYLS